MSEPIPPLRVTRHDYQSYQETRQAEEQRIVAEFVATHEPMTIPGPIDMTPDIDRAREQLVNNLSGTVSNPNPENQAKKGRIREAFSNLGQFIKNHPFYTIGLIVGLILVVGAAHFLATSLAGQFNISIFNAHIIVGGGVVFMAIYYGVYLINMARRAAVKDDLEAQVEAHNKLIKHIFTSQDRNLQQHVQQLNHDISVATKEHLKLHEEAKKQETSLRKTLQASESSLDQMVKIQKTLLLSVTANQPTETKELITRGLEKLTEGISEGAALLNSRADEAMPLIPFLKIETQQGEIPDQVTDAMEENQLKLRSMGERFLILLQDIGNFVVDNPGSSFLIFSGLLMTLAAGIGVYFWFHGATNLFFIGSLSILTLAPMVIYGFSFIYEGYLSGVINDLRRKVKKIEQDNQKRIESLDEEQNRLALIQTQAQESLQGFQKSWVEFHKKEGQRISALTAKLEQSTVTQSTIVEGMATLLTKFVAPLFPSPEMAKSSVVSTLNQQAEGAQFCGNLFKAAPGTQLV